MISRFFTETVTVQRMALQPDGESTALSAVGSVKAHIQQARPEFAEQIGQAFGVVFLLWADDSADLKTGDTLTVASGSYAGTYNLSNIQTNATIQAQNRHLECVLVKDV